MLSKETLSPFDLNQKVIQRREKIKGDVKTAARHFLLIAVAIFFIGPFIWMISTSLKDAGNIFSIPPNWIPDPVIWGNYIEALESTPQPFYWYYWNSIWKAFCTVSGQLLTCSMAAYAFARLSFPGRDLLFFGYLATMMIPFHVTMIPVFMLLKELHWIDTRWGLIVPGIFSAYGTFLLRQFFLTIPKELEEAASMDGASKLRIYLTVILPLSKPALSTLGIFVFISDWNNLIWPIIVINNQELHVLPQALASFQGLYVVEWHLLMAASVIVMLPLLIVYILNQKFITEGIVLSGLKG